MRGGGGGFVAEAVLRSATLSDADRMTCARGVSERLRLMSYMVIRMMQCALYGLLRHGDGRQRIRREGVGVMNGEEKMGWKKLEEVSWDYENICIIFTALHMNISKLIAAI